MKETNCQKKNFIPSALSYKKAFGPKSILIFCAENVRQDKCSHILFKTSDYPPHDSFAINTLKTTEKRIFTNSESISKLKKKKKRQDPT